MTGGGSLIDLMNEDFKLAIDDQILEKRVEDVLVGKKKEFLWILEHNKVYTAGTSSNDKDLLDKSIKVIKI